MSWAIQLNQTQLQRAFELHGTDGISSVRETELYMKSSGPITRGHPGKSRDLKSESSPMIPDPARVQPTTIEPGQLRDAAACHALAELVGYRDGIGDSQ